MAKRKFPEGRRQQHRHLYGAWSENCRHPPIWLGLPNPATALIDQLNHNSDSENLSNLMTPWHAAFGSSPTKMRKVKMNSAENPNLLGAMLASQIDDGRGGLNPNKFGQLPGENANKIVGGHQLQPVKAGGRRGWRVVK